MSAVVLGDLCCIACHVKSLRWQTTTVRHFRHRAAFAFVTVTLWSWRSNGVCSFIGIPHLYSCVGYGCYGHCAWLLRQNLDLIGLTGCGHIRGGSPIIMIIRHPRVAREKKWFLRYGVGGEMNINQSKITNSVTGHNVVTHREPCCWTDIAWLKGNGDNEPTLPREKMNSMWSWRKHSTCLPFFFAWFKKCVCFWIPITCVSTQRTCNLWRGCKHVGGRGHGHSEGAGRDGDTSLVSTDTQAEQPFSSGMDPDY